MDPETGLPKLPELYFWRVKKVWFGFTAVQLRKKTWGGFSVFKADMVMHSDKVSESKIRSYAETLLSYKYDPFAEEDLELIRRTKAKVNTKKLYGNYPPKKLG